jgi:hypothetical protein
MRKWTLAVLIAILLVSVPVASANTSSLSPTFVSVVLDGKKIWFPDAQAYIDANQRTLVPVRFVAESLGAKVGWEGKNRTVPISRDGQDIRLTIGSATAIVNGKQLELDTQAVMTGGRTFVPLRFVSEVLGAEVKWEGKTATVLIQTKEIPEADTDEWGRLIRKTNLPKNAADYPYILADIPNEMYELAYPYSLPANSKVSAKLYGVVPEYNKKNIDIWLGRLKTFGGLWLNVDYQTIDDAWAQAVFATKMQNSNAELKYIRQYVEWVKTNKIQVTGYLEPEPSMIYYDGFGGDYIRVKFRVKFVSFNKQEQLIYDEWFPKDAGFKKNVWYEGYSDIKMKTSVGGDWGDSLKVSSTASLFFNHTISEVK